MGQKLSRVAICETTKSDRRVDRRLGRDRTLLLSASVLATTLMAYGRNAYAQVVCNPSGGTSYLCTGNSVDGQSVTQDNADVTTTGTFSIDTTDTTALEILGFGALRFTDPPTSTTTLNADETGLLVISYGDLGPISGSITIDTAATISSNYDGIFAANYGTGDLSITATGDVTGTNERGIYAYQGDENATGQVTVNAEGDVFGGERGVFVRNRGTGGLEITTTGEVTSGADNAYGIQALQENEDATGDVVIETNDRVVGQYGGIFVRNSGTGALSITANGDVTGYLAQPINGFYGAIYAVQENEDATGDVTIETRGEVFGDYYGIFVDNSGQGDVEINATGPTTGTIAYGILVRSGENGGDVAVTATDVDSGQSGVIVENEGTGETTVTTTGEVIGREGDGVYVLGGDDSAGVTVNVASVSGTVEAVQVVNGGGAAKVTATGDIVGQYGGIVVRNTGTGALSITATGDVTGQRIGGGYYGAIFAVQENEDATGDVTVEASGALVGDFYGIFVNNRGQGDVEVDASGPITTSIGDGILVRSGENGRDVSVTAADVESNQGGVIVENQGSGETIVTTTGNVIGREGDGVYVFGGDDSAGVTVMVESVSGTNDAVQVFNAGGDTQITATGDLIARDEHGLYVINQYGSGSLTIVTEGRVEASDFEAIRAYNYGSGDLSLDASGPILSDYIGVNVINGPNAGDAEITVDRVEAGSGIRVFNEGGDSQVTATGEIVATDDIGIGVINNPGTGSLTIETTDTITAAGDAIRAFNAGAGDITIDAMGRLVSGGRGVYAINRDEGMDTTITVDRIDADDFGILILAQTDDGDITIDAQGRITSDNDGIRVENFGCCTGDISITASDPIRSGATGVFVRNLPGYGDTDITVDSIEADYGITLLNGRRDSQITVSGDITTEVGNGILLRTTRYGRDIDVSANTIDAAQGGIIVEGLGSGTTTVTASGTVTGREGDGVYVSAGEDSEGVMVTVEDVSGTDDAVQVVNGGGDTLITANGDLFARDDHGVYAINGDGSGNLTIETRGRVEAGLDAIRALNRGMGETSITVFGDVVSATDSGIFIETLSDTPAMVKVTRDATVTSNGDDADDFAINVNDGAAEIIVAGQLIGGGGGAISFADGAFDDVLEVRPGFSITGDVFARDGTDLLLLAGNGADFFDLSDIDNGSGTRQYQGFDLYELASASWTFSGTTEAEFLVTGGRLLGDATFGGLTVNGGTVAPGTPTSFGTIGVTGDVFFNPGSTFAVDLGPNGIGDRLVAAGAVTIADTDTTLDVEIDPLATFDDGIVWTIVEADGGVTGQFTSENIVDNLPDIDLATIYNPDTVQIGLIPADGTSLSPKEIHPSAVMAGLDTSLLFVETLRRRGALSALGQITGETANLGLGFMPGSGHDGALPSTLTAADMPTQTIEPAPMPRDWAVWGAAMGSDIEVDNDGAIAGWDASTAGFGFGFERQLYGLGLPLTAGLAAGYLSTGVDSGASDATIDGYHIGLYTAGTTGRLTVSGAVAYAYQDYAFDRVVPIAGGALLAEGDAEGHSLTGSAEAFYDLADPTRTAWRFGPLATLNMAYAERDGFTETGAGILNLTVDGDDASQAVTGLGVAFGLTHAMGATLVSLDARVTWEHVFGDTSITTSSAIPVAGAIFQTPSAAIDRDRLAIGFGAALEVSDTVSAHIRYDGAFSEAAEDHRGSAGLTVRF